ncbi:MAG: tRNA lysidine(34) synthetase TilS [Calditrichaeota bacterium]|nr:MAG: tRNA lysidine(34) synthetase TilS [Calditrichota bacterium]
MIIEDKFHQAIEKYSLLRQNDSVLVALSAGPDSTMLLYLLHKIRNKYKLKLSAVYINHQIRKEAAKEEAMFCRNLCESLNIKLHIIEKDIPKLSKKLKKGIEETGRDFRYQTFKELSDKSGFTKVALGHHADDRVETILFRVIRGTGRQGLLGIQPKRGNYIRPLYFMTKDEIIRYLNRKKIDYCTDQSNSDSRYTRNYIRNELLPELRKKLNPAVESSLLNLSETIAEEEKYLTELTEKKLKKIYSESQGGKILLNTEMLKKSDLWLRRRIFRNVLSKFSENGQQLNKDTIDMIDDFLYSAKTALSLPGRLMIRKAEDVLVLSHNKKLSFQKKLVVDKVLRIKQLRYVVSVEVKNITETELVKKRQSFFGQFDYSKLTPPFAIRTIGVADRFSPLGLNGSKKIGDYLTDKKIAPVFRDEIPVVTDKKGIFWLVGFEIENRAKIDKHTKEVLEIEFKSEK